MFPSYEPFNVLKGLYSHITPLEQGGMAKTQIPKGNKMPNVNTAFDPVVAALKQMHHAVATEEVPEDFMRILDDIDAKIAAAKTPQ